MGASPNGQASPILLSHRLCPCHSSVVPDLDTKPSTETTELRGCGNTRECPPYFPDITSQRNSVRFSGERRQCEPHIGSLQDSVHPSEPSADISLSPCTKEVLILRISAQPYLYALPVTFRTQQQHGDPRMLKPAL